MSEGLSKSDPPMENDVQPEEGMTMVERMAAYREKQRLEAEARDLEELKRKQRVVEQDAIPTPAFCRGLVHPSLKAEVEALPIHKKKEEILQMVRENQVVIIQGETGSGKSTQLVQYLAEAGYAEKGTIVCTQPRRVAAMSMAKRVSYECGLEVGSTIGYAVRFDQQVSIKTCVKFVTDGMLVNEFSTSPLLENYSCIIIDEAHERSISIDVCLGLINRILRSRPELRVIISSATMNTKKFSEFFNNAPIVGVTGRLFPVDLRHEEDRLYNYDQDTLYHRCVAIIREIVDQSSKNKGDILVFLSGMDKINKTWDFLEKDSYDRCYADRIEIIACHGAMALEEQELIFAKSQEGRKKIILSTNVAETSLTVDGIGYVIDTGFHKQKQFNSKTGIETLNEQRITEEMAVQRAGRAGRTEYGTVYRLYSSQTFKSLVKSQTPDIQRSNIESTVLDLLSFGVEDIFTFPFIDQPNAMALADAISNLEDLEALDKDCKLTSLGRKMARFPIDPPLAKTLLTSADLGCSREVASIAALLSTPLHSLFKKGRGALNDHQLNQLRSKYADLMGDHLLLLNVFLDFERHNCSEQWCRDNSINGKIMQEAKDIRLQLFEIMSMHNVPLNALGHYFGGTHKPEIRMAFAAGFFRKLAVLYSKDAYLSFNGGSKSTAYIFPGSVLFKSTRSLKPHKWLLYHEIRQTKKPYMHSCMAVEQEWIQKYAPGFWKRMSVINPEFFN